MSCSSAEPLSTAPPLLPAGVTGAQAGEAALLGQRLDREGQLRLLARVVEDGFELARVPHVEVDRVALLLQRARSSAHELAGDLLDQARPFLIVGRARPAWPLTVIADHVLQRRGRTIGV